MKNWKDAKPNPAGMFWVNYGGKVMLAELKDAEAEIFTLWSNQTALWSDKSWAESTERPTWYTKEAKAEEITFF